mgnify:FL=1
MAQMKTESEKSKLNDQKKSKELLQLRKEKRLRENQVKMLELQNRQKDAILKVYIVFFALYIASSHGGKVKCEIYITATCHKYIIFELQYMLQLLMKLYVHRFGWPCIHFHKHVSAMLLF